MRRTKRVKDYVLNEEGEYEYVGTLWSWPSAEIREQTVSKSRLLFIGAVICLVAAGCVPAAGTFGVFYIILPYVGAVIGAALSGVALVRIASEPDPMRDYIYDASIPSLRPKLLMTAISALVCGVACILHGIALAVSMGAVVTPVYTFLFAACMIGCGVLLLLVRSAFTGIIFDRQG